MTSVLRPADACWLFWEPPLLLLLLLKSWADSERKRRFNLERPSTLGYGINRTLWVNVQPFSPLGLLKIGDITVTTTPKVPLSPACQKEGLSDWVPIQNYSVTRLVRRRRSTN